MLQSNSIDFVLFFASKQIEAADEGFGMDLHHLRKEDPLCVA
jgi:hypothetical protein